MHCKGDVSRQPSLSYWQEVDLLIMFDSTLETDVYNTSGCESLISLLCVEIRCGGIKQWKKKIYIFCFLFFWKRETWEKLDDNHFSFKFDEKKLFSEVVCCHSEHEKLGELWGKTSFYFFIFFLRNCGQSHPESVHSFEIFTLNDEKIFECIFYNAVCYALFQCCHHTVTAVAVHGATVMQVST